MKRLSQIVAEIAAWLETPDTGKILGEMRRWDAAWWKMAQRAVLIQGVSAFLHENLPATDLYEHLPEIFRSYLAGEHEMNKKRLERMHAELAEILRAANRAGIPIMPLKGSALTTYYAPSMIWRPMSDIDLLVHPQDLAGVIAILRQMGYQSVKSASYHEQMDVPGSRVVCWDGEHPDNPRPVEIHTDQPYELVAGTPAPETSAYLWQGAREVDILGYKACLPRPEALYAFLSLHALVHFLMHSGRMVHWLDLALIAPSVRNVENFPHPQLCYPLSALAARALPRQFSGFDLTRLENAAPRRVRHWYRSVPLDEHCGLICDSGPRPHLRTTWEHWRPTPVRLALAYGDVPLAEAYARYAQGALKRLGAKLSGSEEGLARN